MRKEEVDQQISEGVGRLYGYVHFRQIKDAYVSYKDRDKESLEEDEGMSMEERLVRVRAYGNQVRLRLENVSRRTAIVAGLNKK